MLNAASGGRKINNGRLHALIE